MMLAIVAESALRSLLLGGAVCIGLHLLRVRNPHVQMTAWVMVLLASLSMPLLMHWTTVTIALHPSPVPAPDNLWPAQIPFPEPPHESLPSDLGALGVSGTARAENVASVNWWAVATAFYASVTAMLLLRLAIGIHLTWRLISAAKPVREAWAANADVRVSDVIGGPVTFGSTILLPPQCIDGDLPKRRAVLAHEGAHIANGDFYVLLLASLNRAVFWFSPFAWWHLIRLAELAEIISDARAIEVVEDRVSYAEILLDLMQHVRQAPAGLDMARGCTVYTRVERILGAAALPAKLGWRKRIWTAAVIAPVVIVSAGSIAYSTAPGSALLIEGAADAAEAARKPLAVDFYSFGPTSIFTISREGDDLFGQLTWQRKRRLSVEQDGTYSYPAAAGRITLAVSDDRPVQLTLHQNGHDVRAARIAQISGPGIAVDASLLDSYVGWYELSSGRVLAVTRDGDRMGVQETGRSKFWAVAHGADAFAGDRDDLVMFLRDGQADVSKVVLQEPMSGAQEHDEIVTVAGKRIGAMGDGPEFRSSRLLHTHPIAIARDGEHAAGRQLVPADI